MTQYHSIKLKPVSQVMGAYVGDTSPETFNGKLPPALASELKSDFARALAEHQLLIFQNLHLSEGELLSFANLFGKPVPYPFVPGIPAFPLIVPILKEPQDTNNFGGVWHSDTPYLPSPAAAALLHAKKIPQHGGDTLFSNMYMAWEALSPSMKRTLQPLSAIFHSDKEAIAKTRASSTLDPKRNLIAEHPVVRRHPITGKPSLYISEAHTTQFSTMTAADSEPILEELFAHIRRPEFCYRLKWQTNMLVVWDNQSTQHYPVNDYHGERRLMHRISLAGSKPIPYATDSNC